ncbi:MAG: leucine-rich repeat domain-containing protein [Lachnospiraceae bacterium]|nr:leucine-rich repeat domain-containing protein [Ruminococcus sp.]MCM1274850.1 leucine-rich repeat domain-containing protein [Lachnospiraceae bacterium]
MTFEQDNLKLAELFEFARVEDGYELKRYLRPDDSSVTEIAIPPKFRYVNVVSVAKFAFRGSIHLKSIYVPETVRRIGERPFEYCRSLENITLPSGLKITNGLFNLCTALKRVELPEGVDVVRAYTFLACSELEEVVLPKETLLNSPTFVDCPKLRSVIFPGGNNTVMMTGNVFVRCPLLPAETLMYPLIGTNDLNRPFKFGEFFDWDTALRRDVFELAIQHDSFREIDKRELFRSIIDRDLIEFLPLASGMLDEALTETLADYSAEQGKTEITAWLLNHRSGEAEKTAAEKINEKFDL